MGSDSSSTSGTQVLDSAGIQEILHAMADQIEPVVQAEPVAFIGLYTRGVTLARRLAALLADRGHEVPVGTFDISLYRDDLDHPGRKLPALAGSEIDFDLEGRTVILFDEVIFTGRTIRAALEGLMDHGRAAKIRLAVLVDRGHREIPIQPDYVGWRLQDAPSGVYVKVSFLEDDQEESVVLVTPS